MKVSSFLKLVEIQTKVASVIPFTVGVLFSLYRYNHIEPLLIGLFFLSLISVDMATTAINNYMDFKGARSREGYNYETHNAIVKYGLSDKQVVATIIVLLTIGGVFGLALFIQTDIIVLLIGLASSFIGIIYSFGPVPLSRTPLGEIFSGILMGGFIFFIAVYINIVGQGFIQLIISGQTLYFEINMLEILVIAVVAMPMIFMIANIMLANNICDIEDDVINRRYTLPYFIGRKYGILLFEVLYGLAYAFILLAVIVSWLPITCLLVFITVLPVSKGLKAFRHEQTKAETFVVSVKSFIMIGGATIVSLLLSIVIQGLIK